MSEIVSIDKAKLLKVYKTASKAKKKEMEDLYGKEVFILSPMERIASYEDACIDQGLDPKAELPWKNPKTAEQKFDNENVKLRIIAKSLKGKKSKVDWGDSNTKKWRPYFVYDKNKSAFVFSDSHFADTRTIAGVGSRFVFETSKESDYYGKQFIASHNIVLLSE